MKKSYLLRPSSTRRTTELWLKLLTTFPVPEISFTAAKNLPRQCYGLLSENWRSTLIFVKEGTKLNANSYLEDILTPAHVEMKKYFKDAYPFTFQQDGALSHTANKTQDWCESHFPAFWRKELWPPSLPDLNHLDFCV